MNKIIDFIKNKCLRNTFITIVLITLFIFIYVGLCLLLENANIDDIDLTSSKLFTLSQETKDKLLDISDTKILIVGFDLTDYESVLESLLKYADLYSKENSKISYEQLQTISQRPDLMEKYGLDSSSMAVIVESGEQSKILISSDLYKYDYTTDTEIESIEQSITNAIIDVNLENKPKIYFVSNHLKYPQTLSAVTEYLKNEANEVENVDLSEISSVPDDCNVLVISTLAEDFSDLEMQLIVNYINNAGKLLLLVDPNEEDVVLNNYNRILEMYGVYVSNGCVYEQDAKRRVNNYASIIKPDLNSSADITRYIASDGSVAFIDSGKLSFKSDDELDALGVEVTNLVIASETAFLRTDFEQSTNKKTDADEDASRSSLGAYITKIIESDNSSENVKKSELVIFANSIFASDMPIYLNSQSYEIGIYFYNNKDLILNSISVLANRSDTITIRKDTGIIVYTPTEEQDQIIRFIIIALPIFVIGSGLIIWLMRRKK